MAVDRPEDGTIPPPSEERPVSWVSLFRTARAPLAVLVLAAVALIVAAADGRHAGRAVEWRVPLLARPVVSGIARLLSVSAWYWARTLIDARFDVVGTKADRATLVETDKRINPFALAAVPWLIVGLSVGLGLFLIPRGQFLPNLIILLVWVAAFVRHCRENLGPSAGDAGAAPRPNAAPRACATGGITCPFDCGSWRIARPAGRGWRW